MRNLFIANDYGGNVTQISQKWSLRSKILKTRDARISGRAERSKNKSYGVSREQVLTPVRHVVSILVPNQSGADLWSSLLTLGIVEGKRLYFSVCSSVVSD